MLTLLDPATTHRGNLGAWLVRPQHPGAVWHVYNRGVNRADIVVDDVDRALFVTLLAEAVRRFNWVVHQFTLMTNHFHVALETSEPTLSRGMKWFEQSFVQAINRRHGRVGPLFQGRFKSQLVEKGSYLLGLIRYIALNPVRDGMVRNPEDYKWSSYAVIAGFEPAPTWIHPEWILSQVGTDLASQQREFRTFVNAGRGITRAPSTRDREPRPVPSPRVPCASHRTEQKPAGRGDRAIARISGEDRGSGGRGLRDRAGSDPREPWHGRAARGRMARLIGTVLRLRSTSRVSQLIAECDRDLDKKEDRDLRTATDRCLDLLRRVLEPVSALHRVFYQSVGHAASPP